MSSDRHSASDEDAINDALRYKWDTLCDGLTPEEINHLIDDFEM